MAWSGNIGIINIGLSGRGGYTDVSRDNYLPILYAPAAHGRFSGWQCMWCDRLTVPAMDTRRIADKNQPPCALCEKENFQPVFEKSIALWTLKRFLRSKLSEELGDAVTLAVLIAMCGSFSSTMVPLARMHHVYCTILQTNSPFLRLLFEDPEDAEDDAVDPFELEPSVVLDLIFEYLYCAPVLENGNLCLTS